MKVLLKISAELNSGPVPYHFKIHRFADQVLKSYQKKAQNSNCNTFPISQMRKWRVREDKGLALL